MNLARLKATSLQEDFSPFDFDKIESKLKSTRKSTQTNKNFSFFGAIPANSSNNSSKNSVIRTPHEHLKPSTSPSTPVVSTSAAKKTPRDFASLENQNSNSRSSELPPEELEEFEKIGIIKQFLAKRKEQKEEKIRQKKLEEEEEAMKKKKRINLLKVTRRLRKKQRENIMESYLDNMANLLNGQSPQKERPTRWIGAPSFRNQRIDQDDAPEINIDVEQDEDATSLQNDDEAENTVTTPMNDYNLDENEHFGLDSSFGNDPIRDKKLNMTISLERTSDFSPKHHQNSNKLPQEQELDLLHLPEQQIPFPKTFLPKTKSKVLLTSPKSEGAPQEAKIQGLISEYYSEDQGLEELRQKSARMWEKLKESICVETEGDAFNLKKLFMQEKKRKEEEEKKRIMKNSKILFALGRQRGLLPKTLEKAIIKVVGVARVPKENEVVQDPKEYYKSMRLKLQKQKESMNPLLVQKVTEPTFFENSYTPRIIKRSTSSRIISVTTDLSKNNSSSTSLNGANPPSNPPIYAAQNSTAKIELLNEQDIPQTAPNGEIPEDKGTMSSEMRASLFKRRMKENMMSDGASYSLKKQKSSDTMTDVTPPSISVGNPNSRVYDFQKSQMSRILTERKLQIVFPYTPKRADLERQQDRLSQKFSQLMYDEILSGDACFLKEKEVFDEKRSLQQQTRSQWKSIKADLEKCLQDIRELSKDDEKIVEGTVNDFQFMTANDCTIGSTLLLSFQKLIRKNDDHVVHQRIGKIPSKSAESSSTTTKTNLKKRKGANINKIMHNLEGALLPPQPKRELYQ